MGEVIYGNVGVPSRLEFTIVGAAANEAVRLESMCKILGAPLIASQGFVDLMAADWVPLGAHPLRGIAAPQSLYTLPLDGP